MTSVPGSGIITVAVPPTVDATYVIALPAPPPEVATLTTFATEVAGQLTEPLRSLTRRMLDGPVFDLHSGPIADLPPLPVRFLELMGATPDQLAAIGAASHAVVVHATHLPGWPAHEWSARAVAVGLARRLGGVLIDLFVPAVLTPERAARSLPDADARVAVTDWVLVLRSSGERGCWFTTRGLARVGLPELQTLDVPPMLVNPWTAVLNGLARRLTDDWIERLRGERPAFLELPALWEVTEADIARAHGREPTGGGRATVRLRLDPAEDLDAQTFLTVLPPDDYPASAGEHITRVCDDLLGLATDEIRHAPPSRTMDAAIDSARAMLPVARERFLADSLPTRARLIVKHELCVQGSREYVWATVNSWPEPDRIVGTCMNDARLDSAIRTGRPVRVDATTVIDWAVWIDGEGIVEGGWTNQALLD
jgi:hypothetical protein